MPKNEDFLKDTERQPNVNSPNAAPAESSGYSNNNVCFTDLPIVGVDLFPGDEMDEDADIVITDPSGNEVTLGTFNREHKAEIEGATNGDCGNQ